MGVSDKNLLLSFYEVANVKGLEVATLPPRGSEEECSDLHARGFLLREYPGPRYRLSALGLASVLKHPSAPN